jgi:hypothetical protein
MRSQVCRYDILSVRPAAEIEPVRAICSSTAILPGPILPPDARSILMLSRARAGRFRELTGTLERHDGAANHTESQMINYRNRSRRNAGGHHLADLDWLPNLIPGWSRTGGQRAGERLPRRNRRRGITNTLDAANGTPPSPTAAPT